MEPRKIKSSEVKEAIDRLYGTLPVSDAISAAAANMMVSSHTMKKWYYGQSEPPIWHWPLLMVFIKKANKIKANR